MTDARKGLGQYLTNIRLWGNGILLAFGAMRSWFESRQPSVVAILHKVIVVDR